MKRFESKFAAIEQTVRKLAIFCICAMAWLGATLPASADLVSASGFAAAWVQPTHKVTYTSENGKVKAKLVLDQHIFQEGYAKTSGRLTIIRKGKLAGSDRYKNSKNADIVTVKGPVLAAIGDEDEPAIEIGRQNYQKDDYFEYGWDNTKHEYIKRTPSIELGDIGSQLAAQNIHGMTSGAASGISAYLTWSKEFGNSGGSNWHLKILKGKHCMFSQDLQPPAATDKEGRIDKAPECDGPYVSTRLDPTRHTLVDIRMSRVVDSARLACEMIYYYDSATKKVRLSTHEWGLNYPRLAQLNPCAKPDLPRDDTIQYLTEDGCSEKPSMGGPLQIWQWSNKLHELVNVTHKYPSAVKNHSRAALAQFKTDRTNSSLLAYCGDLCTLGHKEKALDEISKLNQATDANNEIIAQLRASKYL